MQPKISSSWAKLSQNSKILTIIVGILLLPLILCFGALIAGMMFTPNEPDRVPANFRTVIPTPTITAQPTTSVPTQIELIGPTATPVLIQEVQPTSTPTPQPSATLIPTPTSEEVPTYAPAPGEETEDGMSESTNNQVYFAPQEEEEIQQSASPYTCSCSKTCKQIYSCDEAYYQLDSCGCGQRDGDGDGIPCEDICE